jgi:predicted solute-binding protein
LNKNQMMGVVSYLNMLPFFYDDSGTCLVAKSPAELNGLLVSGKVAAGCVSNIAGLRHGLRLILPAMGVACRGPVKSVYLEPLIVDSADIEFWDRFERRNGSKNNDLIAVIERKQSRSDISGQKVEIMTSGASEQSLWLTQTLLALQGFESSVSLIEGADSKLQAELLKLKIPDKSCPRVLLSIGDPALARLQNFQNFFRMDVSQLWFERTGLPCVFAAWYESKAEIGAAQTTAFETQKRRKAVLSWGEFEKDAKKARIQSFLEPKVSSDKELNEHWEYLSNISYLFVEGEMRCLELFKRLFDHVYFV